MNARIALLVPVALLALAGTAAAEGKAGDGEGLAWLTVLPTIILMMALPVAVLARATLKLPGRVAGVLEESRFPAVLIGAGNMVLIVLLGWASQRFPGLGPVAAIVMLVVSIAAFLGLCGVATSLAEKLYRGGEKGGSVGAFTVAWLVLAGITLLPVAGFLIHLWLAAQGIGGVVLMLKRKPDVAED